MRQFEPPRLDGAKLLSVDTETYDPFLKTEGPGWGRGKGHIVGVSVGTDCGFRQYFPLRHEVESHDNMDPVPVFRWLKDVLADDRPKVFANAGYDIGWLKTEGLAVGGRPIDVQIAEPLIDENAYSYSLDTLSRKYLGETKVDEELYEWCYQQYKGKRGRSQAANIYRAPPRLVIPYAEGDVDLPLRVWEQQQKVLDKEELWDVFNIEADLVHFLVEMRWRGVRVDIDRAERLKSEFSRTIERCQRELGDLNINSGPEIYAWAKAQGIPESEIPRTEKGNPSFQADWKAKYLPQAAEAKKLMTLRDTFLIGSVLGLNIDGRLHSSFNQLKSDDYGTVSGRFSSSLPNIQNIPSPDKDPVLGKAIRSLFLPDEGEDWVRFDWSQIEFRLLTHYGVGDSAEVARGMYRDNPETDFHTMVSELTGVPRKPAKNINFGFVYGMGVAKLANDLGLSIEEAKAMFATYHGRLPFVKATYDRATEVAGQRGYVKTLLGRRRRFNLWEPTKWGDRREALPKEQAIKEYGRVRRAHTHKGLNSVLQGSAGDIMKVAMVQIWKSGVCNVLGVPLVTVHDELGWSKPRTKEADEAIDHVHHIMEHCVQLKIPLLADKESGPSWGEVA